MFGIIIITLINKPPRQMRIKYYVVLTTYNTNHVSELLSYCTIPVVECKQWIIFKIKP